MDNNYYLENFLNDPWCPLFSDLPDFDDTKENEPLSKCIKNIIEAREIWHVEEGKGFFIFHGKCDWLKKFRDLSEIEDFPESVVYSARHIAGIYSNIFSWSHIDNPKIRYYLDDEGNWIFYVGDFINRSEIIPNLSRMAGGNKKFNVSDSKVCAILSIMQYRTTLIHFLNNNLPFAFDSMAHASELLDEAFFWNLHSELKDKVDRLEESEPKAKKWDEKVQKGFDARVKDQKKHASKKWQIIRSWANDIWLKRTEFNKTDVANQILKNIENGKYPPAEVEAIQPVPTIDYLRKNIRKPL